MVSKEILNKIDIREPLLVEWALNRISGWRYTNEKSALEMEAEVFNDQSLRYMIEQHDSSLLLRVLQVISPPRFSNNLDLLKEIWLQEKGALAYNAAKLIVANDPEAAADLFEDYCVRGREMYASPEKYLGVFTQVMNLPDERARTIARMIVDVHLDLPEEHNAKSIYYSMVLELAWVFGFPEREALFREALNRLPASGNVNYADYVRKPAEAVGISTLEFRLVCDFLEERERRAPGDLEPFYENAESLETLLNAVGRPVDGADASFPSFFEEFSETIRDDRMKKLLRDLLHDREFMKSLRDDEHAAYIYAMMAAAVLTSWKKDKMDLSGAPMEQVTKLLAVDVETIPDVESFVVYFKTKERSEVVRSLTGALAAAVDHWGGVHILEVMGALGYDEFIEPVANAMTVDGAYSFIQEDAVETLKKFRERSIRFLIEYIDRMEDDAKSSALLVVYEVGGPEAVRFLDVHFDAYWILNRALLMSACEAICYDKRLERFEPKLGKGQSALERAYLTLVLLKREKTPRIEELLQEHHASQAESFSHLQAFQSSVSGRPFPPYHEAELLCKNCQDPNFYRLEKIFISSKGNFFIGQEITCINCNTLSDFEFSPKSKLLTQAVLMSRQFATSDKQLSAAEETGPFQYFDTHAFGEQMGVDELVNRYREEIEKNPLAAHNYIGLGNSYLNMGMPTRARDCFTTAKKLDPAYIQAYAGLARIADESGYPEKALAHMEGGKRHLRSPKYWRGSGAGLKIFIEDYCRFYNTLLDGTGKRLPHLDPGSISKKPIKAKRKIGRNAPCPCGSGKKYKKCCLNK